MSDFTYVKPKYIFPHCELCIHWMVDDEAEPCKSCAYDGPDDCFWLNEDEWPAVCDGCEDAGSPECPSCVVVYHKENVLKRLRPKSFEYYQRSRYAKESSGDTWKDV